MPSRAKGWLAVGLYISIDTPYCNFSIEFSTFHPEVLVIFLCVGFTPIYLIKSLFVTYGSESQKSHPRLIQKRTKNDADIHKRIHQNFLWITNTYSLYLTLFNYKTNTMMKMHLHMYSFAMHCIWVHRSQSVKPSRGHRNVIESIQ